MTAKKNRTQVTSPKTKKGRMTPAASQEDMPTEVAQQTEPAPTESLSESTTPPAELSKTGTPTSAGEALTLPEPATKVTPLSALDAAAQVLHETGQAMSCPELIAGMAAKDYWKSPKGRTPAATLYSALLRELQTKGEQARFVKAGRGKFALRGVV
jgi:hypothetical protein